MCHPAVRELVIPVHVHWALVSRLCSQLPLINGLEKLDLADWSCKKYGLLSECNQRDGIPFAFTPNLTELSVCDINCSGGFFRRLALNCPSLKKIRVSGSKLSDCDVNCLTRCKNLEYVSLNETPRKGQQQQQQSLRNEGCSCTLSNRAFAELLCSLPRLKSLGHIEDFDSALKLAYEQRSPGLTLTEISSRKKMSPSGLQLMVQQCPKLQTLDVPYLPSTAEENHFNQHLSILTESPRLQKLTLTDCDFYGHLLFLYLNNSGRNLLHLGLIGVDQINVNALIAVGDNCPNIRSIALSGCHYQIPDEDENERRCSESAFKMLKKARFKFNSPLHHLVTTPVINNALNIEELDVEEVIDVFDEEYVRSYFNVNPMVKLKKFNVASGERLSIHTVNFLVEKCPNLERISTLRNWMKISKDEFDVLKKEIKLRNLNLTFDE